MHAILPSALPAPAPPLQANIPGATVPGGAATPPSGFAAVFGSGPPPGPVPAPITPIAAENGDLLLVEGVSPADVGMAGAAALPDQTVPDHAFPVRVAMADGWRAADTVRSGMLAIQDDSPTMPAAGLPDSTPFDNVAPPDAADAGRHVSARSLVANPPPPGMMAATAVPLSARPEIRHDLSRLLAATERDGPSPLRGLAPISAETTAAPPPVTEMAGTSLTPAEPGLVMDGDAAPTSSSLELRRHQPEGMTFHRMADAPPPAERQIAAAISALPGGRTDILLDPQELGRVRLSIEGDESSLVLTIQAERGDTADLLRRNADLLLQEFRDAGYANLSFNFADPGQSRDQAFALPDDDGESPLSAPPDMLVEVAAVKPATATLDLRL